MILVNSVGSISTPPKFSSVSMNLQIVKEWSYLIRGGGGAHNIMAMF